VWFYSNVGRELGELLVEQSGLGQFCRAEARLYQDWCTGGKKILNYINPDDSNIVILTSDLDELNESNKDCAIPIQPYEGQDDQELARMARVLKHLRELDGLSGSLHEDLESIREMFGIELYQFE
jgi:hypothetical protein